MRTMEWLLVAAASLSLIARTLVLSPGKAMWLDELLTYYALDHPSWPEFWQSYRTTLNAAPPGYFILLWSLGKFIPLSALTLRIFSTLCCTGAFVIVWATLRRHAGFFATCLGTGVAFFASLLFWEHSSEARFYGLYLLGIAWAVWNYDALCTKQTTRAQLVSNSLSHALALSAAYVAGMFSFAVSFALVIRDRIVGLWRPKVYLSVLCGWIPTIFCLPLILEQQGTPAWIKKPGGTAIFYPFDAGIDAHATYFVLFGLAALSVLAFRRSNQDQSRGSHSAPLHLAILALLFLAVPYGVLLISWTLRPLLVDRYSLPSLIGLASLVAFAGEKMWGRLAFPSDESKPAVISKKLIQAFILGGLFLLPLTDAFKWIHNHHEQPRASTDPDFVRREAVVVTTDPHTYYIRHFQSKDNRALFYVVRSSDFAELLHRFHSSLNAVTLDDFLRRNPRFALIADNPEQDWMEKALREKEGIVFEREFRDSQRLDIIVSQNAH